MQEIQLINLLSKYSVDCVFVAILDCAIMMAIRRKKRFSYKLSGMFPFFIGIMFNIGSNITSKISPDIYKIMENLNTNSATYITRRKC